MDKKSINSEKSEVLAFRIGPSFYPTNHHDTQTFPKRAAPKYFSPQTVYPLPPPHLPKYILSCAS